VSSELSTAQAMLSAYIAAEQAALRGQSYALNGQMVTRADLAEIRKGRAEWQGKVNRLSTGQSTGMRVLRVIPRDL
jgi:hypothetical protein